MKNKLKSAYTLAEGATHVDMTKKKLKKAYTLAEVVVVMLIIAVVVAVSIKIAKTKLDNITSYTYYSAYNMVRAISAEMLRDFDAEEEDYSVYGENNNLIAKIKYFFASNFWGSSAWAISCPDVIPCGKECDASTGYVLRDKAGFSRTCDDRYKQWNEGICDCIPTPQTISRSGQGFCRLFANYANTSPLTEDNECNGNPITAGQTEFDPDDADMILRNGMILYNVHQDPQPIDDLNGNSKGVTYPDASGNPINVDEVGYTIYIDIDGAHSGEGKLWEDVYPFYITLSGTVIPAYDLDNPETAGGDSKLHLQTSVHDEFVDASGRHTQWITKSRTFKDSACAMGYVNAATRYCRTAPAVTANPQCALEDHDCRLKTIMPVKFFGH